MQEKFVKIIKFHLLLKKKVKFKNKNRVIKLNSSKEQINYVKVVFIGVDKVVCLANKLKMVIINVVRTMEMRI